MISLITTIQEITMQASVIGVYEYLFDTCNECRDEIFNRFEEWGKEFEEAHKDYEWNGDYYDEIDEFVEKKFTEIKLADNFVEGDYIIFETGLYKITGFTGRGILVDEIRPREDADEWVVTEIGLSQVDKILLVSGEEIMDTTQNHDPELVYKINQAWNEKREQFCPILRALYARDIDEITDADSFQIDMWRPDNADGCRDEIIEAFNHGNETDDWKRYNELALEDMCREWDVFADNYLMHIADDLDLRTILTFLRYKV